MVQVRQRKCDIEYISFSAHVDFVQNKSFIDGVQVRSVQRGSPLSGPCCAGTVRGELKGK